MITDDIFIDSDSDLYLYKNSFIYIQLYIVYSKHYWHLITLGATVVNFDLGHIEV